MFLPHPSRSWACSPIHTRACLPDISQRSRYCRIHMLVPIQHNSLHLPPCWVHSHIQNSPSGRIPHLLTCSVLIFFLRHRTMAAKNQFTYTCHIAPATKQWTGRHGRSVRQQCQQFPGIPVLLLICSFSPYSSYTGHAPLLGQSHCSRNRLLIYEHSSRSLFYHHKNPGGGSCHTGQQYTVFQGLMSPQAACQPPCSVSCLSS